MVFERRACAVSLMLCNEPDVSGEIAVGQLQNGKMKVVWYM